MLKINFKVWLHKFLGLDVYLGMMNTMTEIMIKIAQHQGISIEELASSTEGELVKELYTRKIEYKLGKMFNSADDPELKDMLMNLRTGIGKITNKGRS